MRAPRPTSPIPFIDWLKATAIVAVVTAHSGPFALSRDTMGLDRFVRVTLVTFQVPVFLMVSGFLHASAVPIGRAGIAKRGRAIVGPYLVASLVMMTLSVERTTPLAQWPFALAIGNALGIYYYVPVWLGCVLTGWAWSRLSPRGLGVAFAVAAALTVVRQMWHPPLRFLWAVRDPLLMGWTFCYLLGWCARRFAWDRWIVTHRWSIALALASCTPWLWMHWVPGLTRLAYSVGVAWLVVAIATKPAPPAIRWLAGETLLVYLWHLPIATVFWKLLWEWPDVVRLPLIVGATLAVTMGGIALLRTGQRWARRHGDVDGTAVSVATVHDLRA